MSKLYKNKYLCDSLRLKNWDYSCAAAYFITICTKNREHHFGKIINGNMALTLAGKIAEEEWIKTVTLRPDMNLRLGEFVVMPDHFHGIIIIGENINKPSSDILERIGTEISSDALQCIASNTEPNIKPVRKTNKNKFGPQSKNLASIIRGFKGSVTRNSRKINSNFAWQPDYYERIIRDELSFERISNYIRNNPKNWKK